MKLKDIIEQLPKLTSQERQVIGRQIKELEGESQREATEETGLLIDDTKKRALAARNGIRRDHADQGRHHEELLRLNAKLEQKTAHLQRVNQTLVDSEERLRLAIATGKIGLWVWNSTDLTNSGDWSPRLKEIFDLPLDSEVTHEMFLNCVHPEDRARVNEGVLQALNGIDGGNYFAEYRAIHVRDGSQRWLTARGQAFFNPEGQAIRFIGTVMDITERKCAEEALTRQHIELEERFSERTVELIRTNDELRRSKAYLELALELSRTGSVGYRVSEKELFWSPETARMYGYDPAIPPTKKMVLARVHPNDLPLLEEAFVRVAAGGAFMDFKHRLLMPDGSIKYLHTRARPVKDEKGHEEILGALTDITEQVKAKASIEDALAKLQNSEDQLRTIIDTIPTLVWSSGADGAADFFSQRWLDYTGLSKEEAQGQGWTEAIHPEDIKMLTERWVTIFASNRQGETEARLRRFGGEYRWFLFRAAPLIDQRGNIVKWYGTNTDIDDRKRAEEALRRSKAYLEHAQKLSHTGSVGFRVSNGQIFWSEETARIYGYDPAIPPTMEMVLQRVHPDDVARLREVFLQAAAGGASFDFEHRLLMPDGSIKYIANFARSVKDEAGQEEVIGAITDITERKQAAEALNASEHLARGQLEALTNTLGALARETDPDKILEHVVCMIVRRLGAHSIGVWALNETTGRVELLGTSEGERLLLTREESEAAPPVMIYQREHPVWSEFFRSGSYCVQSTIAEGGSKVRILDSSDTSWHDWLGDVVDNPNVPLLFKRLAAKGVSAALSVPMFIAGKVTGFLGIRLRQWREFRREEIALTRALAHQVMLAIQLTRLTALSRQSAVLQERTRLARDIHDSLAQGFTGVIMQLEAAEDALSKGMTKEADGHLIHAGEMARYGLSEARRSVQALRPQTLEEKDFSVALEEMMKKVAGGTNLEVEFILHGEPRPLAPEWDENLLRIGQEALTNALRHAHAKKFIAELTFNPQEVRLELRDDGCGYDQVCRHDGFGLVGIRERVEWLGGQMAIHSALGQGTAILIALSLARNS